VGLGLNIGQFLSLWVSAAVKEVMIEYLESFSWVVCLIETTQQLEDGRYDMSAVVRHPTRQICYVEAIDSFIQSLDRDDLCFVSQPPI